MDAHLTQAVESALLHAAPSFEKQWQLERADHDQYVERYPDAARTPDEWLNEFTWALADHLGKQVARGEMNEATWLFAALESLYERASADLEACLTINVLEGIINVAEREGVDAASLDRLPRGPRTELAWRRAFAYTHGGELPRT
jgi:hypothetical protein